MLRNRCWPTTFYTFYTITVQPRRCPQMVPEVAGARTTFEPQFLSNVAKLYPYSTASQNVCWLCAGYKQTISLKNVIILFSMYGNKDISQRRVQAAGLVATTVRTFLVTMKGSRLYVAMTPEPPETVTCGALWLYEKAKTSTSRDQNEGTNPICIIPLQWPLNQIPITHPPRTLLWFSFKPSHT